MSVTSEKILKSVDVILGEEEKKEAEKKLKELEDKLKYPDRYGPEHLESVLNYYAQEMPKHIMKIFLKNKLEPMTRETIFKKLKEKTASYHYDWEEIWQGYYRGYQHKNDEIPYRLRTIFDDILRCLVENNYVQYYCYSTVCHYVYRGKK